MSVLNITDKEIGWLKLFGDPAQLAKDAVYFFVKNKIEAKMEEYQKKCLFFEKKYESTFHVFGEKVECDESYVKAINAIHPLWEKDMIQWEFYHKELEEWTKKLRDILEK